MDLRSLVEIFPSAFLTFDFTPEVSSESQLCIENKSELYIEFRILTKSSKMFSIIPVHGILKPKEAIPIKVTLKPVKELDSQTHKFEITITPRSNSKVAGFRHKLKADFASDFYSKTSGKMHQEMMTPLETEGCQEEIITEIEVSSDSYSFDQDITRLREEVTSTECRLTEISVPTQASKGEGSLHCQAILLIFFIIGVFLGAYVLS